MSSYDWSWGTIAGIPNLLVVVLILIDAIETYLGQHLIRAYLLPTDAARSDTTSFSVYHQPTQKYPLPYLVD